MNKHEIKKMIAKENPVVLDIGCYNGKDSKELADILNCEVHCFEPDPLSQEIFLQDHMNDRRLKLYGCALTNIDGEIDFYQSDHPQSNSARLPHEHLDVFPDIKFDDVITVSSERLDTWYQSVLKDKIIDFIWADVNGSEKDLIYGGIHALSKTRFLYIEAAKKELYQGQPHYDFLKTALPNFKALCMYNWGDNFGNILLKNMAL